MKVIWEESDIEVGRRFKQSDSKEVSMIGYDYFDTSGVVQYSIISLRDGQIYPHGTKQELVSYLNKLGYIPLELLNSAWRKDINT